MVGTTADSDLAVTATIVGQALVLGRLVLLAYATVIALAFVAFVRCMAAASHALAPGRPLIQVATSSIQA